MAGGAGGAGDSGDNGGSLTQAGAGDTSNGGRAGGGTSGRNAGNGGTGASASGAAGEGETAPGGFHMLQLLAGKPGAAGDADGTGVDARLSEPSLLALDAQGNLFIHGNYLVGGLRKLDLFSNTVSTTDLAVGAAGFCADGAGGFFFASLDEVVRQVSNSGTVSVLAGLANSSGLSDGIAAAARFNFAGDNHVSPSHVGMMLGPDGDLFLADTGNHTIRRIVIATGAVTTVAGTPGVPGSADGAKVAAQFSSPTAMTVGPNGHLFIADYDNKTIRSLETTQGTVVTIAGAPGMAGSTNGAGVAARFSSLTGLAADLTALFVADGSTIRRIGFSSPYPVTTLAGVASTGVPTIADGPLVDARFGSVADLVVDRSGNLLIADGQGESIREIGPLRTEVHTLAGAAPANGSSDGAAADARFYRPGGVVADDAGNVFVADTHNQTLREISAAGQVSTLAGTPGMPGSVDGTGASALFWLQAYGAYPSAGLVLDGTGHLFVTDSQNQTVRELEIATGNVTSVAGSPRMPSGIALDNGELFVADEQNDQIGRLSFAAGSWTVTTLAGGMRGSNDGTGTAAQFNLPCNGMTGMATDGHGTIFVSDSSNHTIRQIVEATREVTTLAGTAGMVGSDDGVGPDARFNQPSGIAADGAGSLYIADFGNSTLRKLVIATREVSTVVGVPGRQGIRLGPLPGSLFGPTGVAMLKDGGIVISDSRENAILVVR